MARFAARLSQALFDFVVQLLPPDAELAIKDDVRLLLQRLLRTVQPNAILLAFGSTANGFALCNSDMDLCCLVPSLQRLNASDLVTECANLLQHETNFHVLPLPHARIPIVKLSLDPAPGLPFGIACDIGFDNRLAIENTRLLYSYAKLDPTRVRTLVLFLKIWSKRRKINSPYKGTLSSYGYVLLVIYFLIHVKNPPVLPNLQKMPPPRPINTEETTLNGYNVWFFDDTDLLVQRWHSENSESVAQLLIDFFRYFSRDFSYNTGVASIRMGLIKKEAKGWASATDPCLAISPSCPSTPLTYTPNQFSHSSSRGPLPTDRNRFCIEDPFETDYNVARCVTKDGLYTIRGEFMRASRILATRPERPTVALADLCQERRVEDLVIAPTRASRRPYPALPRGQDRDSFFEPAPALSVPLVIKDPRHTLHPPPIILNDASRSRSPSLPSSTPQTSSPPTSHDIPATPPIPLPIQALPPPPHIASHTHMLPQRSKWTSPPPEDASFDDRIVYERQLDRSLELGTRKGGRHSQRPGSGSESASGGGTKRDEDESVLVEEEPGQRERGRFLNDHSHRQDIMYRSQQRSLFGQDSMTCPTTNTGMVHDHDTTESLLPPPPPSSSSSPSLVKCQWKEGEASTLSSPSIAMTSVGTTPLANVMGMGSVTCSPRSEGYMGTRVHHHHQQQLDPHMGMNVNVNVLGRVGGLYRRSSSSSSLHSTRGQQQRLPPQPQWISSSNSPSSSSPLLGMEKKKSVVEDSSCLQDLQVVPPSLLHSMRETYRGPSSSSSSSSSSSLGIQQQGGSLRLNEMFGNRHRYHHQYQYHHHPQQQQQSYSRVVSGSGGYSGMGVGEEGEVFYQTSGGGSGGHTMSGGGKSPRLSTREGGGGGAGGEMSYGGVSPLLTPHQVQLGQLQELRERSSQIGFQRQQQQERAVGLRDNHDDALFDDEEEEEDNMRSGGGGGGLSGRVGLGTSLWVRRSEENGMEMGGNGESMRTTRSTTTTTTTTTTKATMYMKQTLNMTVGSNGENTSSSTNVNVNARALTTTTTPVQQIPLPPFLAPLHSVGGGLSKEEEERLSGIGNDDKDDDDEREGGGGGGEEEEEERVDQGSRGSTKEEEEEGSRVGLVPSSGLLEMRKAGGGGGREKKRGERKREKSHSTASGSVGKREREKDEKSMNGKMNGGGVSGKVGPKVGGMERKGASASASGNGKDVIAGVASNSGSAGTSGGKGKQKQKRKRKNGNGNGMNANGC